MSARDGLSEHWIAYAERTWRRDDPAERGALEHLAAALDNLVPDGRLFDLGRHCRVEAAFDLAGQVTGNLAGHHAVGVVEIALGL